MMQYKIQRHMLNVQLQVVQILRMLSTLQRQQVLSQIQSILV